MVEEERRVAILFNPVSGAGLGEAMAGRAATHFAAQNWQVSVHATRPGTGALEVAAEVAREVDRLVVAGGDGTLREAIEGVGAERARLAVGLVPLGNANVVARELGIPLNPAAAIPLLTSGQPRKMDLGRVELRDGEGATTRAGLVLAVVGIGWDARTVDYLDRLRASAFGRRWYRAWADSAYLMCGLAAMLQIRPPRFHLHVDGRRLEADYCGVHLCNLRTYAKGMSVAPGASAQSQRIHFQARKRSAPPALAWHFGAAAVGWTVPAWLSDYGEGRQLFVEGGEDLPVQIDGDFAGHARSVELAVVPAAVAIVAP